MYEQQFGLKKCPFLATATGNNVFVGPQTAKTMSGMKNALISQDAVVAVFGPPGAGKTTLVNRSLDALSASHTSVRINRMQLEGTDVLEFMLYELGATELPKGTIRRFTALREKLSQLEANGKKVVVVVEDAIQTGAETVAELEALTAADGGESGGAAIVLMGDHRLVEFLKEPQLARLGQRIREHRSIEPLRAAELRAYLLHCFRLAGTDFEQVFDQHTADLVHELSKGIPRVANQIVESALTSAAAAGIERIPASFVADVAKQVFGLDTVNLDVTPATDIPELIQDTYPNLEILVPNGVGEEKIPELVPEPEPRPEPPPEVDLQADPVPELEPVIEIEAANSPLNESAAEDVPEWDRDPTLAQLRPDLHALEEAMAIAQSQLADEPDTQENVAAESQDPELDETTDEIPEITLDDAIQSRIEDVLIDEPGQISTNEPDALAEPAEDASIPEVRLAPRNAKKADAELERIAAELDKAKAIEEVDDKLAENLLGEEVNLVTDPQSSAESANDDDIAFFDNIAAQMRQASGAPTVEVLLETRENTGETGLDTGASQRLQTVRALNANLHSSLREPENTQTFTPPNELSQPTFDTPASIEDQMQSSMTQTLKALNVKPPISKRAMQFTESDDEEQEPKKTGFFGRFKRS